MDDFINKVSMIDQLIINEKKSKQWTVAGIVVLCILGIAVFVLSYRLNSSNAKFKEQNVVLGLKNDTLIAQKTELDSLRIQLEFHVSKLKQDSQSFVGINNYQDSVSKASDTVKVLLNKTISRIADNNPEFAKENLQQIYQQYYPDRDPKEAEKLINSILAPTDSLRNRPPEIGVSLLYMPDDKALCIKVGEQLRNKKKISGRKIVIAAPEVVKEINFNNSVRYFSKEDKEVATNLANYLNEQNRNTLKKPFEARLIDYKAPPNQLEIWIGEYRPKDVRSYLDKSMLDKRINR